MKPAVSAIVVSDGRKFIDARQPDRSLTCLCLPTAPCMCTVCTYENEFMSIHEKYAQLFTEGNHLTKVESLPQGTEKSNKIQEGPGEGNQEERSDVLP